VRRLDNRVRSPESSDRTPNLTLAAPLTRRRLARIVSLPTVMLGRDQNTCTQPSTANLPAMRTVVRAVEQTLEVPDLPFARQL
jgi:hypothetical protein